MNAAEIHAMRPTCCEAADIAYAAITAVRFAGPHDHGNPEENDADPMPGDDDPHPEDSLQRYRELLKRLGEELKKWRR